MNKPSDKKPESEETFLLWTFLDIRDALVDIDKSLQGLSQILASNRDILDALVDIDRTLEKLLKKVPYISSKKKDTDSNTSTNSNTNTDNNTR
jgi:hypothetical protein